MKTFFILLSGGSGSRMQSSVPKQFLLLNGKPVIHHSAAAFASWKHRGGFVCVSNPDYIDETKDALSEIEKIFLKENLFYKIVPGGKERHESTLKGIEALSGIIEKDDLLFFHDAARPLLLVSELDRLFALFSGDKSAELASLVSPVTETLVRGDGLPGKMSQSLNRNEIFSVKTPQVLKYSALEKLNSHGRGGEFTDLLTWGEACGIYGSLAEADFGNIKLTNPSDLEILSSILEKRNT